MRSNRSSLVVQSLFFVQLAVVLAVAISAMSGCATSREIAGPNGKPAYFIKCGSAVIDACYAEAGKVCPSGYSFLDKNNSSVGAILPVGNSLMLARGPNTFLVECKSP